MPSPSRPTGRTFWFPVTGHVIRALCYVRRVGKGFRAPACCQSEPDPMDDLLIRSRAFRALAAMRQNEPKVTTASMLRKATGYSVEAAVLLRKDLESWGLIKVEEGVTDKVPWVEMRLTDAGRQIADLALKADAIATRVREKHKG